MCRVKRGGLSAAGVSWIEGYLREILPCFTQKKNLSTLLNVGFGLPTRGIKNTLN